MCQKCKLNSRMRALTDFLPARSGPDGRAHVYVAEQLIPLYRQLLTLFPWLVGSKLLGNSHVGGRTYTPYVPTPVSLSRGPKSTVF